MCQIKSCCDIMGHLNIFSIRSQTLVCNGHGHLVLEQHKCVAIYEGGLRKICRVRIIYSKLKVFCLTWNEIVVV